MTIFISSEALQKKHGWTNELSELKSKCLVVKQMKIKNQETFIY